jgi:formylglycine-generating enzyme required for sulfatase activity
MRVACSIMLCCLGALLPVMETGAAEGVQTPLPETITNSLGMKLNLIPAGSFLMGSEKGDSDEQPVSRVTISAPFYMGVYEVTQEEYEAVMKEKPFNFQGAKLPADNMLWEEAQEFCRRLGEKEGVQYRLPTETEWEYACRAGTQTEFYWGDDFDPARAWFDENAGGETHEVGTRDANPWGLYDMAGNVFEWCEDWYADTYPAGDRTDPHGPANGEYYIIRGGSWEYGPKACRSTYRSHFPPNGRYPHLGFRVVMLTGGEAPEDSGFEPIFNGKDLSGWDGDPRLWSVQDGVLVGETTPENAIKKNNFLIWRDGAVEDFVLRASYKIDSGNSGIQYRSQEVRGYPWRLAGYQGDLVAGESISGIVYEERARGILANLGQKVRVKADGEIEEIVLLSHPGELIGYLTKQGWNHYEITARGNHIEQRINGVVMSEVIDEQVEKRALSGLIGLQLHTGAPMRVEFKDIMLKHLSAKK